MKTMTSLKPSYRFNSNLIKEMVKYLAPKDLCSLSLVSKFYHSITKEFDYRFKEICNSHFCSDYHSFDVEMKGDKAQTFSTTSIHCSEIRQPIDEKALPLVSVRWKELFNIGVCIKQAWKMYNKDSGHPDVVLVRDMVYDKLMESKSNPKLRIKHSFVECDFNSPLQKFLFDFLYEQQELYEEYSNLFIGMKFNVDMNDKDPLKKNKAFSYFITDYEIFQKKIRTEQDKEQLQFARWYYIIDTPKPNGSKKKSNLQMDFDINLNSSNDIVMMDQSAFSKNILFDFKGIKSSHHSNKPVKITIDFVKEQLANESNLLFFILKCLYLTLMFHCQYTMTYLFHTFNSPSDPNLLLSEYLKRYKNYVESAIDLNNELENISLVINHLYEFFFLNHPTFPKFSIFRMCLLIWNTELNKQIDDKESMLSCIKMSFMSLYSTTLHNDLAYYFRPTSFTNANANDNVTGSFGSTPKSSHSSASYTLVTNEANSEKGLQRDQCSQYIIIEQTLSAIMDTFCNEYSVFSLNLFKLSSNSTYDEVEGSIMDAIENEIRNFHHIKVEEGQAPFRTFVEDIIKYFTSGFYAERIINQLKRKIYKTIQLVFNDLINLTIKKSFEEKLMIWNIAKITNQEAENYLMKTRNDFKTMGIYNVLQENLTKRSLSPIVIESVIVKYLSASLSSGQSSHITILRYLENWLSEENVRILKKSKQVFKEIDGREIPTEFDENQLMLLSLFQRPSLEAFSQEQACESVIEEDVLMNDI